MQLFAVKIEVGVYGDVAAWPFLVEIVLVPVIRLISSAAWA